MNHPAAPRFTPTVAGLQPPPASDFEAPSEAAAEGDNIPSETGNIEVPHEDGGTGPSAVTLPSAGRVALERRGHELTTVLIVLMGLAGASALSIGVRRAKAN